jgi:hypothetical protein
MRRSPLLARADLLRALELAGDDGEQPAALCRRCWPFWSGRR